MGSRKLLWILAVVALTVLLANGVWAANTEKVLYSFTGGNDGGDPAAALVLDQAGNLYGTTVVGGSGAACMGGCGTVFKLTRNAKGRWQETVIYNFQAGADGKNPYGASPLIAKEICLARPWPEDRAGRAPMATAAARFLC